MNPAAIHLALNNFPPFIDFAALVVLALGLFWRSRAVVQAALVLLLLAGLVAVPVFLSGQRTEPVVKKIEGVNATAIDPHEEAAEWAFGLLATQGVVALAALLMFRRREYARWALVVIVIVSAFATLAVFRTASLGGRIHHPESHMK